MKKNKPAIWILIVVYPCPITASYYVTPQEGNMDSPLRNWVQAICTFVENITVFFFNVFLSFKKRKG